MTLSIVILAAGQGKRMYSQLPKVLHRLAGKSLLEHVVQTAEKLHPSQPPFVIIGHGGSEVKQTLAHLQVTWIEQSEQLGTGHAVLQALPAIPADHRVLVLYGDVPLVGLETLRELITTTSTTAVGMITTFLSDPTGFGRILRDDQHRIIEIIEEKDLGTQTNLNEINSGIYLFPAHFLSRVLSKLTNQNAQREFYLTDVIKMAVANSISIHSLPPQQSFEILGVNNRLQLANLERLYQRHLADRLLQQGVTIMDPNRLDIRGEVSIGQDVTIDVNVIFEGRVTIGDHCYIGPHTFLCDATLHNHVEIKSHSVIEDAEIGDHCSIGPFARIRPGSNLASWIHIGNFVEIKNSTIEEQTKINHLSYIGDSQIGRRVNVGAGTITCNYDGANKHRTLIGDEAFIGSNSQLVAPVHIGEGATIGAGSTITRDAPPHQLTLCRGQQRSIKNWKRPQKKIPSNMEK